MPTARIYADLYPDTSQDSPVLVALTGHVEEALRPWLAGEVSARGVHVGWTRNLQWWSERAGLAYRDPVAPSGTAPAPSTGRLWPHRH